MVIAALLVAVRPGAGVAELLLVGLVLLVVAVATATTPQVVLRASASWAFAELRVLLRGSDPDAAGHRRARAPGRRA